METEEKEIKTETKVAKKHGPLYWVIVILGVTFIVYMSMGIGEKLSKTVDPDVSTNNSTESESNKTSNVEEKQEENNTTTTELTDDLKKEISNKLAMLFYADEYNGGNLIESITSDGYQKYILSGNLDEKFKAYSVIRSSKTESKKIDKNNAKFDEDWVYEFIEDDYNSVVTKDEYDANYKKLFGANPTSYVSTEGCPNYHFEHNSQQYMGAGRCGASGFYEYLIYIDNFELKDNTVIVSSYVGVKVGDPDGERTYSDYLKEDETQNKTVNATTITEENKTSFTKYSFTFEKLEDGNYYYKSVTKTN